MGFILLKIVRILTVTLSKTHTNKERAILQGFFPSVAYQRIYASGTIGKYSRLWVGHPTGLAQSVYMKGKGDYTLSRHRYSFQ